MIFSVIRRWLILPVLLICFSIFFIAPLQAYNIEVGDEVYGILERLEAEGLIKSALLATKPISVEEARRLLAEAESNTGPRPDVVVEAMARFKRLVGTAESDSRRIRPESGYMRYVVASSGSSLLNYNNNGDAYHDGGNYRAGFSAVGDLGWASMRVSPEFRASEGGGPALVLGNGYVTVGGEKATLLVGKEAQWWESGYHGSIMLSNNARPLTMISLTNRETMILPSILKYLGPFKYSFFVTQLERDRDWPRPYLYGMRFDFKPSPYVEIGFERTAMLGGSGRASSSKIWIDSILGINEHGYDGEDAGDQRAGGDMKFIVPWSTQPFVVYGSMVGEDSTNIEPTKRATIIGTYLPRILTMDRLSARVEYASTVVKGLPMVWYTHHIYTNGYRYYGDILGHHMGPDAHDLFFELSYLLPRGLGNVRASYDRENNGLQSSVSRPVFEEYMLSATYRTDTGIEAEGAFGYARITDRIMSDVDMKETLGSFSLKYRF